MIKFRRLKPVELKELEGDFVKFLATNSIPAADWEKMKKENPKRIQDLIDEFSNLVLETAYQKVNHLLLVRKNELQAFQLGDKNAEMFGVKFDNSTTDLTQGNQLETIFKNPGAFIKMKPRLFNLSKEYSKPKPDEVSFLISIGARIRDEKWFVFLKGFKN